MASLLNWYLYPSVLIIENSDLMSMDDAQELSATMLALLNDLSGLLHIVLDNHKLMDLPRGISQIEEMCRVMRHRHCGDILMVDSQRPQVKHIVQLVLQVSGLSFNRVTTKTEGLELLQQRYPEFNWYDAMPLTTGL